MAVFEQIVGEDLTLVDKLKKAKSPSNVDFVHLNRETTQNWHQIKEIRLRYLNSAIHQKIENANLKKQLIEAVQRQKLITTQTKWDNFKI